MTEDATTGIPSGIKSLVHRLDRHGHYRFVVMSAVLGISKYLVEIDDERHITIYIDSSLDSVHPHFCLMIDTIETDIHIRLRKIGVERGIALNGQHEGLAIPSSTTHCLPRVPITDAESREGTHQYICPTARALTLVRKVKGWFHTEVMGHGEGAPFRIIIFCHFGIDDIATMELPTDVEAGLTLRHDREQEKAEQGKDCYFLHISS